MIAQRRNIVCALLFLFACSFVLNAQPIIRPGTDGAVIFPSAVPWVPVKVNRQWGYADTTGRVRIEPTFDAVTPFSGLYAVVQIGNRAFVIDTSGTIITPEGHDQILQLEDSVFAVYKNSGEAGEGGWGAVKIGGLSILPMKYDRITRVSYLVFSCVQDTMMGFFNRNGVLIAPAVYDTGWVFNNAFVALKKNKRYGIRTFDGNVVLPDSCSEFRSLNSFTVAGRKNGKWGAGNSSGQNVIPFAYDTVGFLSTMFAVVGNRDSLYVYTTTNTAHKVPGSYIRAIPYATLWVKAYTADKKCAVIDTAGNIVVPPLYDDVTFAGNGNWLVVLNGKYGVVDPAGKVLVTPAYDLIQPFRNGMSVIIVNKLQGLINERGAVLSQPANCSITIRGNTAKVVHPNAKVEYIKTDGAGNIIQRDEYEEVRVISIGGDNSYKTRPRSVGSVGGSGQLVTAPRGDSLIWFLDVETNKFGLLDAYRGDTLLPAIYSFASKVGFGYTIVGIYETSPGIVLDGVQQEAHSLMGLFDDSLGRFVIRPQYTRLTPFTMSADGNKTLFQCVRKDGMTGLVRADGTERILQASCIDIPMNGVAAFCVGGKWEMSDKGACRMTWENFTRVFNLSSYGPFGNRTASFNGRFATVSHVGGKWGFIDSQGNILIEPQYESYQLSVGGTCLVRLNKKWGMIDTTGKTLIPFEYDFLRYMFTRTDTLIQSQRNKVQMGCIDTLGNIVVPIQYTKIIPLGQGFIAVNNAGKWAVARTNGQLITEEKYLEVRPFSEGYCGVRVGRKWGIIDTNGTEITAPVYDDVAQFSEGMCAVKQSLYWGYINTSGSLIINHLYTTAHPFFRGVAPVKMKSGFGLIDRAGETVVKPTYSLIERVGNSTVFSYRKDGVYGLMSPSGKVLIPARYTKLKDIGEGRLSYQEGLYWGMMDTLGNRITNSVYDRMGTFSDGLCPVNVQGQWGFITVAGKYRVAPKYRLAGQFGDGLASTLDLSNNYQFIDTSGKVTADIRKNAGMTPLCENKTVVKFVVKEKTHYQYYTRFGHRLSRDEFTQALPFYHGAAPVKVGFYWGLINFTGRYLVRPCYAQMSAFRDGIAIVQHNATYGLHALNGTQLLPAEYDVIVPEGFVIRLQRNNEIGYLRRDGSTLWPMQE